MRHSSSVAAFSLIIINDPEGEYSPLVNRLKGQVIKISPNSTQFINPMDIMNENDRTTLEQAIYEEMELTPEMIRSIRTLCGVCLCSFVESKAFKIAIVPSADRSMDTCTVCQTRRGHDYVVMNR